MLGGPGRLDERVPSRILAETGGNPLALLELPRALTFRELAGGFGVMGMAGLPGRIEESFRRRLEVLPADTQRLLLVAAAKQAGEPVLMWRAAQRLGIGPQAAAAAEAAGLLTIGERVIFRHPLMRSAVYRAASPQERRAAHQALAEATNPGADPHRHACTAPRPPWSRMESSGELGTTGGPRPGTWRHGRGGHVRAVGRADPRSQRAGQSGRWPRRRPSTWPGRSIRR